MLLANGDPVERGTLDGGKRHYAVWQRSPPQALLPVRAGRRQPRLLSPPTSRPPRAARSTCASTSSPARRAAAPGPWTALKRSMRWDEERFGREYDLDVFNIVAVSDFNMGAMENKGLNIFNDALVLASPETATDASFSAIERVIAHEYFHNWTGNRITCRDWFQLCLKEGPDRLPRPGVLRRRALADGAAHPRRAHAEGARSSPRTRARSPIPCVRAATSRSTTSIRRPSTTRAPSWCA